jgi:catechol 2,3-dioxygenase-like lactoylglutathione lyase family enzyme
MIARSRLLYGLPAYGLLALSVCFGQAVFGQAVFARAQGQKQNAWSYDHMHLAAPDPQQAMGWYVKNLGGKPSDDEGNVVPMEKASRVVFDGITFIFQKSATAQPSSGSVIDSIGFSFADVYAKQTELEAAGAKVTTPFREVPGLWRRGAVDDPWGTKIELVQDPDLLGFHHIGLRVADPEESLKWYVDAFGGERSKMKGRIDGVKYGRIWLTVASGIGVVPSQGHSIDHLGFRPTNLDAAAVELKAKGVKFTMEPRVNANNGHHIAYVEGPGGVRIELVQHP